MRARVCVGGCMGVGLSSSLHFVVIFANSKTGIVSFVCGIQFKGARKKERHHMETTIGFCATNYMEMCGLHQSSNLSYAAGPKDASRNLIQNKKMSAAPWVRAAPNLCCVHRLQPFAHRATHSGCKFPVTSWQGADAKNCKEAKLPFSNTPCV